MHSNVPLTDRDVTALLNDHGLRTTRQRQSLYLALAATTLHPTADELFTTLRDSDANMSLATVYNTLEAFCNAGLAQKLSGDGHSARYDAAVHNHAHMRDVDSGKVRDVPDELSEELFKQIPAELLGRIEKDMGFKIRQIQVEFVGEPET